MPAKQAFDTAGLLVGLLFLALFIAVAAVFWYVALPVLTVVVILGVIGSRVKDKTK
jgi:hypothetical protein